MFLVSGPLGVQALSCFLHHSSDRTARAHRLNATVQYMIIYIYWFFYVIRSCLAFAHRLDGTLYKAQVQKLFSHNDRLKTNAKIIDWIRIAIFSKSIVIEREREPQNQPPMHPEREIKILKHSRNLFQGFTISWNPGWLKVTFLGSVIRQDLPKVRVRGKMGQAQQLRLPFCEHISSR